MSSRSLAVARRALSQLRHDHRFLALSLAVPVAVIYVLKVFFDSAESPVFNPRGFVVPVGVFLVHFLTYVLCTIVLVRERTAQTLARMFVSGYRRWEIVGGYLLAYTTLATAQSLLVLAELNWLFDLQFDAGRFASMYLVIWLLAVISMALGILVSNFARNEGQVFPFIPAVILPSIFLSGIVVAVERLPGWAQALSRLTPVYYANRMAQTLLAPGGTLADDVASAIALPLYGVAVLALATLTLRELD